MRRIEADILVVGAGAAGLAATAELRRAGGEVVLLEARDRPGGRVHTVIDPRLGVPIELGAEFVHGRPPRTLALARQAGLRVAPVPERHASSGRGGGEDRAFARAMELLAVGGREGESFREALARTGAGRRAGRDAVRIAEGFLNGFYLADPATASASLLARMNEALEAIGGEEAHRAEGGWGAVLRPLVDAAGPALRLSCEVTAIAWRRGRVEAQVLGPGGEAARVRARQAIVTIPVPVLAAGSPRFSPALPAAVRRALSAIGPGRIVKLILRFREPPWGGGEPPAFLRDPGSPVPVMWSLAPLDAPVLVGWSGGRNAARVAAMGPRAAARAALGTVARALRVRDPGTLLDAVTAVDWSRDPRARGGYAVFPAGAERAPEILARPIEGTLFLAGEATAGGLAGTVEGALQEGERAAREVMRR